MVYENTRVKLLPRSNHPHDYINACYVDVSTTLLLTLLVSLRCRRQSPHSFPRTSTRHHSRFLAHGLPGEDYHDRDNMPPAGRVPQKVRKVLAWVRVGAKRVVRRDESQGYQSGELDQNSIETHFPIDRSLLRPQRPSNHIVTLYGVARSRGS